MKRFIILSLTAISGLFLQAQDTTWLTRGELARTSAAKIDCYTRSLETEGESVEALFSRASAYQEVGNFKSAIDDYTRIIALDSSDAGSFYTRGFVRQFFTHDYPGAFADFSAAFTRDTSNAYYMLLAGFSATILKDYPVAVNCFGKSVAAVRNGKSTMITLGAVTMSHNVGKSGNKAELARMTLCDYMPTDLNDAWLGLASAELFSGHRDQALKYLKEVTLSKPLIQYMIVWFKPCDTDAASVEKNNRLLSQLAEEL